MRFAKAPRSHTTPHTVTDPVSVSGHRLPLSHVKLGVRDLFIWHLQRADLKSAQKHNNLLGLNAVLGIR
jgi:hypothetical protein